MLRERVNRFVEPAVALRDARSVQTQIELRRLVLMDIEAVRRKLRSFTCSQKRATRRSTRRCRLRRLSKRVRRSC